MIRDLCTYSFQMIHVDHTITKNNLNSPSDLADLELAINHKNEDTVEFKSILYWEHKFWNIIVFRLLNI